MANLEKLIAQQEQLMNAVSRVLPNFKKLGKAKWNPTLIRQRITNLKATFAQCQGLDVDITLAAIDVQRTIIHYFVSNHFIACEAMFDEASDFLAEALEDLEPKSPVTANTSSFEPIPRARKLPALNLPTFDSSYEKWEEFRDRFRSIITNDRSLLCVDKLHYLLSCLTGEASKALGNLACTNANFEVAWKMLVSRFENKRQLMTVHLQTLLNLPQVKSRFVDDLRTLRDTANAAIQALNNLGRQTDQDELLVFLVSQKLDFHTREAWELKIRETREFPSYFQLDDFLEVRIRSLTALFSQQFRGPLPSPSRKPKSISSHSITTANAICPVCQDSHELYRCGKFRSFALARRGELIKQYKRCLNCIGSDHNATNCPSKRRCRECSEAHHTLLHASGYKREANPTPSVTPPAPHQDPEPAVATHMLAHLSAARTSVMLATARVIIRSSQGRVASVRALLDQGSAATLISENLVQLLQLKCTNTTVVVSGIWDAQTSGRYMAWITVCPVNSPNPSLSTNAIVLTSLTRYTPPRIRWSDRWLHLKSLSLADHDPFNSDPIDIIIGADLYDKFLRPGLRQGHDNEPTVQNTAFGWILSGRVESDPNATPVYINHCSYTDNLDELLRQFWTIEELSQSPRSSREDEECETHFRQTHSRNSQGRYIVRLPFKSGISPELGKSRYTALSCLKRLERRFTVDASKAIAYSDFINEYLSLKHMELITGESEAPNSCPYYIPHHAVYRETSTTSRVRVVFNASSVTSNGKPLNDYLSVGPKLQTELPSVIIQWRLHRYALCADIAKMYRQILIDPRDADYQPFCGDRRHQSKSKTSAPFLAHRVLKQLIHDEGLQYPRAVPILQHHTYVDDCIFGDATQASAIDTRDQLIALLSRGGFSLRKWASNCPALLAGIDPSDHGLAGGIDMNMSDSLTVLGLSWKPDRDIFHFRISMPREAGKTKRRILSTISKFFDPLGWVSPVVITAKILIQRLWTLKCVWDDEVPPQLLAEWTDFHSQLAILETVEILRWMGFGHDITRVELYGFADASMSAYAAVIYLRIVRPDESSIVSLIVSKTKVAPLKTISVPRLELSACLLLARLIHFTRSTLSIPAMQQYVWTDSMIALAWLKQAPSRWTIFVGNRVARIQELTSDVTWRHIPSIDNPVDCASRGLHPAALVKHHL